MPELNELETDLNYVREIVGRAEEGASPSSVYFLWAGIVLVGWPLNDFYPQAAGLYWMLAGPLGGIASAFLGARWARRVGQASRLLAIKHSLHWGAMLGAILLAIPLQQTGQITPTGYLRLILLLVALTYFLAGLYLSRPLLWVAAVVLTCYIVGFFVDTYLWTGAGIVVASSLAAAGFLGARHART